MTRRGYQPEIDGLRAIAVTCVLLFHLEVPGFSGGFVGVDIFFVISGYLITRLIRDEWLATGAFSFGDFYVRRARRLFPALFATIALTSIGSYFILSPDHFERFGGSSMHAVANVSNFFFWLESGYFDADARVKPLLHTWSLSVEEQFYLLWPALLVFLLNRKPRPAAFAGLIGLGLASFFLNHVFHDGEISSLNKLAPAVAAWFADGQAAIYFLTPFRIFEFAIGGVLVFADRFRPGGIASEALFALGLVLIAYPVYAFTEETVFPYYNALAPCFGAALLIYAGQARFLGIMLRNRAAVGVGLISYSLYLVHWPLIVFAEYGSAEPLGGWAKTAIFAASVLFAFISYRFVETPFRRPQTERRSLSPGGFGLACALLAIALIMPAAAVWAHSGWPWRFKSGGVDDLFALDSLQNETIVQARSTIDLATFFTGKKTILVIGDSHSTDVGNALTRLLGETHEVRRLWLLSACWRFLRGPAAETADAQCKDEMQVISQNTKLKQAQLVVFSTLYKKDELQYARDAIDFIRSLRPDTPIVFMGRSVSFWAYQEFAIRMLADGGDAGQLNKLAYERYYGPAEEYDKEVRNNLVLGENVRFVSKVDSICREGECSFLTPDGRLVVWDATHWTLAGGEFVMSRILADNADAFGL